MGTSPDVEEDCRSAPPHTSKDLPTLIESTAATSISACSRKRKVDDEEAVECCPLPMKRRFESQLLLEELMAEEGKFLCLCAKWVSLRTDLDKSLEHWERHLLTCQQSKAKGVTSLADLLSAAREIFPSKMINVSCTSLKGETSASAGASGSITKETMVPPNAERDPEVCCPSWEGLTNALESGVANGEVLTRKKRPNRTEAERIQDFLDDPQVREVEPYRVLCCSCNKWIKLRKNSRYCSIPWKCHKSSCKKNAVPKECGDVTPSVGMSKHSTSLSKDEVIEPDLLSPQSAIDFKVPPANTHPSLEIHPTASEQYPLDDKPTSISKIRRPRLADAENRKAVLEADPNAQTVEPVLCALCKKWVKLRPNSTYCSAPWQSHIRRCVAKAEKKGSKAASIVNSRMGESDPKTSECDSVVTVARKRRRRPKEHAAQRHDGAESDNSYESEEQQ